jgi:ectoine hydroxylase-related dioxygenase (phytanoyl-CoA dioxygenase family)
MNTLKAELPDLNETIKIHKEQIKEFREKGHTLLRNILSKDEVSIYRDVIINAANQYNTEKRKLAERDTYGKAFLQIKNLWTRDEGVRKFTLAKRFGKIAADLLGVKNVRIYHDQALLKEPGGGPTPWHQDQYYFPVDTLNTVTMWMPLVDINADMGMLTFASGSHKKGYALEKEISDESEVAFESIISANNYPVTRAEEMKAGDATWHYGYTIHKAPGNNSGITREVMTIIYVADGAKIIQPQHKWQDDDHKTWLMGLPMGNLVASELNPLVL